MLYGVGGNDGMSWLAMLDSYSSSKYLINSRKIMPYVRSYTSVTTSKGELYIIGGGYSGWWWYNTAETFKYNPANDDWTSLPCMHTHKGGLAASTLYDKIYAIGGGDGLCFFSDVELFDVNVGQWTVSNPMCQKRLHLAAAKLNCAIYAGGGYDEEVFLSSAERYDPREKSWSGLESMSSRRAIHSMVVLNEKLYAIGGFDGSKMVASVEVFDPRRGSWMNEAPMNLPTGYMSAVVLSDSICAIGGLEENSTVMEKVERYQEGVAWQLTSLKGVGKRWLASATVI